MMIAQPLRDYVSEQQVEGRYQDEKHGDLADLDAEVEAEQRGDHVVAGELQGFAQGEGKAEAVHEAEHEGDDPAPEMSAPSFPSAA